MTSDNGSSPRLAALQQALESGDSKALDAFWQRVVTEGTPLVEPIEGDDDHSLVTFLWRAEEQVPSVAVISALTGLHDNQMIRLPNSDLWYRTTRARNDVRATYQIAPGGPSGPIDVTKDRAAQTATWQHDPLNPNTFVFESIDLIRSVIELPNAPPQPWIEAQDGTPAGTVEQYNLQSDMLGNERPVWLYTPPGYTSSGEPCGLLVMLDGDGYLDLVPTPTILDNLLAAGSIPPTVAVLPHSLDGPTRMREMLLHPPFNEFLAQELVPWARQRYNLTSDPAQTIIGGSSAGGLAAAYAALEHSDIFGNVISQSGAFRWKKEPNSEHEWLTRQFALREKLELSFYIEVGKLEANSMLALDGPDALVANRHLRTVLQAKGYPVHYHEYNGGHDYLSWRGTLAEGLQALHGKGAS
jgi:enterochelin esterase family protein